jgi:hypothetical protein
MSHVAVETYSNGDLNRIDLVGKPRILVVAYPDLADAIYEALDADKPPFVDTNTVRAISRQIVTPQTLSQLCSQAFPPREKNQPIRSSGWRTFLARVAQVVVRAVAEAPVPPVKSPVASASFFEWSDYDYVLIQDLWIDRGGPEGPTLQAAGYELAHIDYYVRGNFNTKKIILVTDDEFLTNKAKWENARKAKNFHQIVRAAFDEKNALTLVRLNSPHAFRRLRDIVAGNSANATDSERQVSTLLPSSLHDGGFSHFPALSRQVRNEIAGALRSYIRTRAEVIFVDDEPKDLTWTYKEVTGSDLMGEGVTSGAASNAIGLLQERCVFVAQATRKVASAVGSFSELVKVCMEKFDEAVKGDNNYVLLVTDILFKLSTWEQTGIDLIEELRRQLLLRRVGRHFGIVAFTGFSTPFITMSSYQRGADFVVSKLINGRHDINTTGTNGLLMALASLCFQKSFLEDKRREIGHTIRTKGSRPPSRERFVQSLRQLQAVLPRPTVSLHLQQEWLDTCYLIDAMTIYELGSSQLEQIFHEVSNKYD